MTERNTNLVKGARGRLLEAERKAAERDAACAQREAAKVPCICGHGECSANSQTKVCRACRDSVRWTGRVPTGLSDEAADAIAKIVHLIPRAKNRAERYGQSDSGQAAQEDGTPQRGITSALHDVAEAISGGRKVVAIDPVLPDVNLDDPAQRKHLANCVLLRGMNFEAGVRTAYPRLKPVDAAIVASHVQQDKTFQADIQEAASQRGISDADKATYLAILWRYASSTKPQDYQDRGTALRLLGKVFLPEGIKVEQPQKLQISGLEEGLNAMGLTSDVLAQTSSNMPALDMTQLNDEADSEQEYKD
jgi:hypothetical protein